jgi:hypothetical protein
MFARMRGFPSSFPLWRLVLSALIGLGGCATTVPTTAWVPPAHTSTKSSSCPMPYVEDFRGPRARAYPDADPHSIWIDGPGMKHDDGWVRMWMFSDPCRQGNLGWNRVRLASASDTLEFDRFSPPAVVKIPAGSDWMIREPHLFDLGTVNDVTGIRCSGYPTKASGEAFTICIHAKTRAFVKCAS